MRKGSGEEGKEAMRKGMKKDEGMKARRSREEGKCGARKEAWVGEGTESQSASQPASQRVRSEHKQDTEVSHKKHCRCCCLRI